MIQPFLPGVSTPSGSARAAEVALLHFADAYLQGLAETSTTGPLPQQLDELSFACLILCSEWSKSLGPSATALLRQCQQAASEGRPVYWMDRLPWSLALEAMDTTGASSAKHLLVANLSHHNSSVRGFMLELGWFVRARITVDEAGYTLLKNVADTIFDWDLSTGLCSSLFADEKAFWGFAEQYKPPDGFEEQYQSRLQDIKSNGLIAYTSRLLDLELRVRRRINDFALGLECLLPG
jgi:hypothetical protein